MTPVVSGPHHVGVRNTEKCHGQSLSSEKAIGSIAFILPEAARRGRVGTHFDGCDDEPERACVRLVVMFLCPNRTLVRSG